MFKTSVDQINYLNIGLMIVSAALAFFYPFELFLVVYAFLGPLHYLTEISWLHDRNYFTKGKYDYLFLAAFSALITLVGLRMIASLRPFTIPVITLIAFLCALIFISVQNTVWRILLVIPILIFGVSVSENNYINTTFGLFMPTIIHVCIFTGMFILIGSFKSKNLSGFLSLLVFLLCIAGLFIFYPAEPRFLAKDFVQKTYQDFSMLNYTLMTPFSQHDLESARNAREYENYLGNILYATPKAFAFMSFIAFSYTYHYLNWFSKTSIIQWHDIPRSRFITIIAIWIMSIAAFLYDYGIGLTWLTFLSLSHVMLEFPLNHLTFINIGKEFRGLFAGKAE